MRQRGKKDANHDDCLDTFEQLGCSVVDTHAVGIKGFGDAIIGLLGVNHFVDVKNLDTAYGRKGLNANQDQFNAGWRGEPIRVVTSPLECVALVQNWRRSAR